MWGYTAGVLRNFAVRLCYQLRRTNWRRGDEKQLLVKSADVQWEQSCKQLTDTIQLAV